MKFINPIWVDIFCDIFCDIFVTESKHNNFLN
jgi:hypothetical protein